MPARLRKGRSWRLPLLAGAALSLLWPALADPAPAKAGPQPTVLLVVGAPGENEYQSQFASWVKQWEQACGRGGCRLITVGLSTNPAEPDRDQLQRILADLPKDAAAELWLVLIGHGTFAGQEAKFNLRGPDVAATELAGWLEPFRRPLAILNLASASGPFLRALAGEGRVILTATRSGHEQNFARFGQFFSAAITDPAADLDKDDQTSLLEAYLTAARQVKEFYDSEGRLATEHPLLDDTGDGLGTPPDWFRGIRATQRPKEGAALDGLKAHQWHLVRSPLEQQLSPEFRDRRNALETQIASLRENKPNLSADEYYRKLEPLLVELARLYESTAKSLKP